MDIFVYTGNTCDSFEYITGYTGIVRGFIAILTNKIRDTYTETFNRINLSLEWDSFHSLPRGFSKGIIFNHFESRKRDSFHSPSGDSDRESFSMIPWESFYNDFCEIIFNGKFYTRGLAPVKSSSNSWCNFTTFILIYAWVSQKELFEFRKPITYLKD